MGADYISLATKDEPAKAFAERKAQDKYDYGHAGYTGTFAEVPSVKEIPARVFPNRTEAEAFCMDHAEKWETCSRGPICR